MWYASCSIGAHWISPSITVPGDVDDAGASAAPRSSGIPSGPIGPFAGAAVVPDEAAVEVCDDEPLLDDELPQPANASAAHTAVAVRNPVFIESRKVDHVPGWCMHHPAGGRMRPPGRRQPG